jgi:hypothetical protein
MSREQLPYMTDQQFHQVAFVYRSKKGCIKVANLLDAKDYDKKPEWEHLATLDAHRWIECLLRSSQKLQREQIRTILK